MIPPTRSINYPRSLLTRMLWLSMLVHGLVFAMIYRTPTAFVPPPSLQAELRPSKDFSVASPRPIAAAAPVKHTRQLPRGILPVIQQNTHDESQLTATTVKTLALDGAAKSTPSNIAETPTYTPPLAHATYLDNPHPSYPLAARRRGQEGTVRIEVLVERHGQAKEIRLKTTSGVPDLDQAALTAIRGWRFVPARRGTESVEGWITIPIRFQLEDSI